jgi:hypothetical protein
MEAGLREIDDLIPTRAFVHVMRSGARYPRATARPLAVYALVTSAVVLGATACGGSTPQSAGPVLGDRFSGKVEAECKQALAAKKAEPPFPFADFNPTKPDLSKLPAIARYEERGVQIFRSWESRMLALGSPPSGQAVWAALIRPLRAHARLIADQQAAASRGDGATFTHDYYAGNKAQEEMVRAASAAGVPICATAAGA